MDSGRDLATSEELAASCEFEREQVSEAACVAL